MSAVAAAAATLPPAAGGACGGVTTLIPPASALLMHTLAPLPDLMRSCDGFAVPSSRQHSLSEPAAAADLHLRPDVDQRVLQPSTDIGLDLHLDYSSPSQLETAHSCAMDLPRQAAAPAALPPLCVEASPRIARSPSPCDRLGRCSSSAGAEAEAVGDSDPPSALLPFSRLLRCEKPTHEPRDSGVSESSSPSSSSSISPPPHARIRCRYQVRRFPECSSLGNPSEGVT
jgi:hypothetical protein